MTWPKLPLADVLEFREGPGILAADFHDSGIPLVRLAGLKRGRDLLEGCNFLDPAKVEARWSQFRLREGDVLLSTSASLGEVAVVGESAVGAVPYTGLIAFRPKNYNVVHPGFIPLMLRERAFRDQIEAMGVGSVMKHFGPSHLRVMSVTVPPLREQRAIAEVLGALDDKIAANTTLIAAAEELAIAKLHWPDAPRTHLGNVVFHRRSQVNPAQLSESTVAHYSLPAFDQGAVPETVDPGLIKSGKFVVDTPAVLVSKLNPQTPRIWRVEFDPSTTRLASTEFLVLEPFTCTPQVLWAILNQPDFSRYLQGLVAGTTGSHQRVRPADVLGTSILDPREIPSPLHDELNAILRPVDALKAENRTLAATRDTLLPQLMSGKLRVRDAAQAVS